MADRPNPRPSWLRLLPVLAILLVSVALTKGQSARWQPDRGTLGLGQTSEIQLVLEDCSPDGTPVIPSIPGLSLELAGQSQSTEIVNFNVTRRTLLTYLVRASQRGAIRIPPFEVKTDKGLVRVRQAEFQIGEATVGQSGATLDSIVQSKIVLPPTEVWAGEVFPLNYTLSIARRFSAQLASNVEWTSAPLTAEEWSKPEMAEVTVGGENRTVITYRTRALSKTAGTVALKPAQQLVNLQTGTSAFGLFARPTMEQFTITAPATSVSVKPLPSPSPAGFTGAVGEFALVSKVVPTTATVGEPVTWTLDLSGTGNWTDISTLPPRDVSRSFRVVQPQAKRTTKEGTLFDASLSEDVVLIATKPGAYTLGPIRWTYFDPKSGTYRTLATESFTVTVTEPPPPASAPGAVTLSPNAPASGQPSGTAASGPPPTPALPRPIPRDPLSGQTSTLAPMGYPMLVTGASTSLLAVGLLWLGLALQRARATDPLRARREARVRLLATLSRFASSSTPEMRLNLLRDWCRDSVTLLGLARTTPSAEDIGRQAQPATANDSSWSVLWKEAERALYGPDDALPADWLARAETAARAYSLEPFSRLAFIRARNLAPFLLVALILAVPTSAIAAEPETAYREGKFAAAEELWRDRITVVPTDWVARHNLALALGQQDRWGEAAAHSTAAFVQRPGDPSVQWHLVLALQRAGYTPTDLAPFLTGSALHRAAHLFSPGHWKLAVILSAWILAGALGIALLRGYGLGSAKLRSVALAFACAALLLATTSFASLHLYRSLADRGVAVVWRAAVLRSIPTEAATNQKTTPLAAGSLAVVDKHFLNWRRLVFPNGQTGWVHAGEIVPLWQSPAAPLLTPARPSS